MLVFKRKKKKKNKSSIWQPIPEYIKIVYPKDSSTFKVEDVERVMKKLLDGDKK